MPTESERQFCLGHKGSRPCACWQAGLQTFLWKALLLPRPHAQSTVSSVTCLSHSLCSCPLGSKAHRKTIQTTPKFRTLEEVLMRKEPSPSCVSKKGSPHRLALGYSQVLRLSWCGGERGHEDPGTHKPPQPALLCQGLLHIAPDTHRLSSTL